MYLFVNNNDNNNNNEGLSVVMVSSVKMDIMI